MIDSKTAIDELTAEELKVKLRELGDLLCVCAGCKSIRVAEANWKAMEDFLWDLLGREVSHGICPSCQAKANQEIDEFKLT